MVATEKTWAEGVDGEGARVVTSEDAGEEVVVEVPCDDDDGYSRHEGHRAYATMATVSLR